MLLGKSLFYFLFAHLINSQLQINLYLTDWISDNDNDLQHDCLNVAAYIKNDYEPDQIISYCMGEDPSKWNITENNFDQKFNFSQLSKQNVTNQQLYLWSGPIDVIERYQLYLNQLPNSEETSMASELFYNCTLPYFGPKCQYVLHDSKFYHSSLYEIVHEYYYYNKYTPATLTCYTHLQCDRGPSPSCLDWSEICDGQVDCLDGGSDEKHCWQLEIHQCGNNEYRCTNGQCIHKSFLNDDSYIPDCLDKSDEPFEKIRKEFNEKTTTAEPSFRYEDITCVLSKFFSWARMSSCIIGRQEILFQAMFSIKPNSISDECWSAFRCIVQPLIESKSICNKLCWYGSCNAIIQKTCPDIFIVPSTPALFGHVYLIYNKTRLRAGHMYPSKPEYICYDDQRLYSFHNNKTLRLLNYTSCRLYSDTVYFNSGIDISRHTNLATYIRVLYRLLWPLNPLVYNDSIFCNKSNMYQCINSSKWISKSRLHDGIRDCYYRDDDPLIDLDKNCSTEQNSSYFKCKATDECIPRALVQNGRCDCTTYYGLYCDDEYSHISYAKHTISFQTICDGFTQLAPQSIDYQGETDETNCEQWPPNNIYTRCDGFWHVLNGSDEINCDPSPLLNCSSNHHRCVSSTTNELMCLPIEKANDGKIDCIGAADERQLCRPIEYEIDPKTFYCKNDSSESCIEAMDICNSFAVCAHNDDQQACKSDDIILDERYGGICTRDYESFGSDVAKVLCRDFLNAGQRWRVNFTFQQTPYWVKQDVKHESRRIWPHQSITPTVQYYQQYCHRGLNLEVWLDKEKNLTKRTCLCPPSFYGDICQYQNQRVSLTMQLRVTSDSAQIPFILIISLIDDSDERIIHSYEQITFIPALQCEKKFNAYLLYSTRPKNEMIQYSIHIDIYEKITLKYRGSVIQPLIFPFLAVHRLAFQLAIPRVHGNVQGCSDHQCVHGKCIKYSNDPDNKHFCQCQQGWSGRYCTKQHTCSCSVDSLCIGILANNRSLCVCPPTKIGDRCLIDNTICEMNENEACLNDGQCILIDQYGTSKKKFFCICPKGFYGNRCEMTDTKLIVSFDKNIIVPQTILIHFIEVKFKAPHVRTTIFKTNPVQQDLITIHWSFPFHITLIDLSDNNYYLTVVQKIHKQSATIEKTLNSSHRCLHISEIFNETIVNYSLLRRIKYYHLPCQTNSSQISCFYDEVHFCLCQEFEQQQYVANCFEFDHNMTHDCLGENICENGGSCFQEDTNCPRTSMCSCVGCFYGARCQLSTNGFSLSLDAILGYHIRPNINISHQSHAVLISLVLSLVITLAGVINGVLSLITFKNKNTRQLGSGLYLLCSSIITLLAMVIFSLKFWILILSQMGSIMNRLFFTIQCISIDFLLRFCLTMDQWLTACVAIERAYISIKGINFDQKKMKRVAKWTMLGLVFLTISTAIHDPISRRLFDEHNEEEKRIWCIVDYSSPVQVFNLSMNIFHFIVPFIINVISAIVIIIMTTRQRATVLTQHTYQQILNDQFQQHKNLLIGPCVLIILGIPRFIISFTSGCMKSASDSWLFLLGYFISIIPSTLTFILFVLPSSVYKQAFHNAISRYRKMIRRRT